MKHFSFFFFYIRIFNFGGIEAFKQHLRIEIVGILILIVILCIADLHVPIKKEDKMFRNP